MHSLCPITQQSDNTSQGQSNSNHWDKLYTYSVPSVLHTISQSDNTWQRQSNSNHEDKVYIHPVSSVYTHTLSHHISSQITHHDDNLTAIIGTRYTHTLSHQQSDSTLQRQSNSNHWDQVYKHSVTSVYTSLGNQTTHHSDNLTAIVER
jgi:hypothetical protein